jgi:hypothetical protein
MVIALKYLRWATVTLALFIVACSEDDADPAAAAATAPEINTPPTITGSPSTSVPQNIGYMFAPSAADADGDPLIFAIDAKPPWADFDTSTGLLNGTPTASDVGVYRGIVVSVSDGEAQTLLPAFDLTVVGSAPANSPPTISGAPASTVVAGSLYSFTPTAADANGDSLVFSIRNRPSWAIFTTATGRLRGTPQAANARAYDDVIISVSDGSTTVALAAFSITVTLPGGNSAPSILGTPASSVEAGSAYAFVPTASDADGDPLTFSISGRPAWAAFSAQTGALTGTPPATGTFSNIVIGVSDGTSTVSLASFSITVTPSTANAAPLITGTPATSATEGVAYSFQPAASDADNDPLTYTIANRPTWATFNTTTGRLQGTPGAAHVRAYNNVVIGVSDGKATAQLSAFSITVEAANVAPTISGTPATGATVGTQYAFLPTADDANGDTLTFSIVNRPSWASFNTTTGRLQGTPGAGNVGAFATIGISVSDGQVSAALASFTINVSAAANRAPTITGTPAPSAMQGVQYTFLPGANDPDGDVLTFSITNKPSWATFTASTGQLQGTPGPANVGTTTGIVISVSDGEDSAALAAFDLTVQAIATGSATLSWTPPTQNDDGSPLTNLAGYRVYWGTSQNNLPNSTTINTAGVTSHMVENLLPGTYFFATTAFNTSGMESARSNIATKTIQ